MSALLRCCCFLSPAPPDSSNQSNALNLSRPGIRSSSAVVSSCTPEQNAGARCHGAPSEAHDATVETSSSSARPDPSDRSSALGPASSDRVSPTPVLSPCTREQDAGAPVDGQCNNAHDVNVEASSSPAPPAPSDQRSALDPASSERVSPTPALSPCTREQYTGAPIDGECNDAPNVIVEASSRRAWLLARKVKKASVGEVWSAVEVERKEPDQPYVERYDENNRTRRVTVKIMPRKEIDEKKGKMREDPMNEIEALDILSQPGHPRVLQKEAALEDESKTVYLLMPAINEEYKEWNPTSLEAIETARKLFRQLVEGIEYVHSKGICHSKLCLENVFFDGSGENAYIINFGWSFLMTTYDEHRRLKSDRDGRRAKDFYCSPETLKGKACDGVKADVFAAGAMLFRMVFDAHSSTDTSSFKSKFKRMILEEKVAEELGLAQVELFMPNGEKILKMSEQAAALVREMMASEPERRPTPVEVLKRTPGWCLESEVD